MAAPGLIAGYAWFNALLQIFAPVGQSFAAYGRYIIQ
jgi:hypothetical protein